MIALAALFFGAPAATAQGPTELPQPVETSPAPVLEPAKSVAPAGGAGQPVYQDGADWVVKRTDGTVMRGRLVELVPGHHVTIELATREIRRTEWADLAPAAAPAPADTPRGRPRTKKAGPRLVAAEILGDGTPARLERLEKTNTVRYVGTSNLLDYSFTVRRVEGSRWTAVCALPCRMRVDPAFLYRITGDTIQDSQMFRLLQDGAQVRASTASSGWHDVGVVGAAVGGGVAFFGLLVLDGANDTERAYNDTARRYEDVPAYSDSEQATRRLSGAIALGSGLVVAGVGAVLAWTNRETRLTFGRTPTSRAAQPPMLGLVF